MLVLQTSALNHFATCPNLLVIFSIVKDLYQTGFFSHSYSIQNRFFDYPLYLNTIVQKFRFYNIFYGRYISTRSIDIVSIAPLSIILVFLFCGHRWDSNPSFTLQVWDATNYNTRPILFFPVAPLGFEPRIPCLKGRCFTNSAIEPFAYFLLTP